MDDKKPEENLNEKNKTKKVKEKKATRRERQIAAIEEDIKKYLENISVISGDEPPVIKIIDGTKFKNKGKLFFFLEIVFSIILLIALTGYFKWIEYEKIYQLGILICGIVLIEYLLSFLIDTFFLKTVIFSFGAVKIIPSLLAFLIACIFAPGIDIINYWLTVLVYILYIVVKKVTIYLIRGKGVHLIRRR